MRNVKKKHEKLGSEWFGLTIFYKFDIGIHIFDEFFQENFVFSNESMNYR